MVSGSSWCRETDNVQGLQGEWTGDYSLLAVASFACLKERIHWNTMNFKAPQLKKGHIHVTNNVSVLTNSYTLVEEIKASLENSCLDLLRSSYSSNACYAENNSPLAAN